MAGPTIPRRQLGRELRQLRVTAGESQEQVARIIKCSPTKVHYLESGRNVIGYTELVVILQHWRAADKLDELEALRLAGEQKAWYSGLRLPESLATLVGLETEAERVRSFQLVMIEGLLQTAGYAREHHHLHGVSPDDLERRVSVRLRRQERLTGPDSLQLTAVLFEAALQTCLRHPSIAVEQFEQLIEWAQLPNVEIRVLPYEVGLYRGMEGAFSLLSFPENLLPDAGWQENPLGGHVIDDQADVAYLATLHDELRSKALGSDESRALLAEYAQKAERA